MLVLFKLIKCSVSFKKQSSDTVLLHEPLANAVRSVLLLLHVPCTKVRKLHKNADFKTIMITVSAAALISVKDDFAFRGKHAFSDVPQTETP